MDSAIIGKVEKAKFYAQQPQRITFQHLTLAFEGDSNTYTLELTPESWECSCMGFQEHHICPHIMTMERLLGEMLKRPLMPYADRQNKISDVSKAIRYSAEPERITLKVFEVVFEGDHHTHVVGYDRGKWNCDDPFFQSRGYSSHTMALERLLGRMLKK
jgi:hypothetical protein